MRSTGIVLILVICASVPADAGIFSRFKAKQEPSIFARRNRPSEEVPGGHPPNLVTTNGVEVPAWASKRMRESPVPLYGKSWGRRPWALPLSTQATPSAVWARADQNGFGAGPLTGYTNDYGAAGNYPMAHVGSDTVNGWAPPWNASSVFAPPRYPFNTGLTGY